MLLDLPDLVVVGGHLGFPWMDELVTLTVKFPNLYVDTSAYAAHRFPAAFLGYMTGVGDGRVMFGTNWPMLSPAQCLDGVGQLGLSDDQVEAYLSGTARDVFGL